MKLCCLIVLCGISLFCVQVSAQQNVEYAAADVMKSMVASVADRSFSLLTPGDSVAIDVDDIPDKEWFITILVAEARKKNVVLYASENGPRIRIGIVEASTRYTALGKDSVERRIVLDVVEQAVDRPPTWTQTSTPRERIDIVSREQAIRLQSTSHFSTQGALPPVPTSWWDDILEPVVFVGATVVTAVLLFTVRSQ
jgi:hypothetical protein